MSTPVSYRLSILGAALLFSTGGAAIKACGLSGWQIASFRSGLAALVLLSLVPAARRGWSRKTWLVGLGYAATMILFVLGNKLTTAANTIFLQSTAPLYILVLSPWLLGERARRSDLFMMLAIAGGLALFFVDLQPVASAPDPLTGNLLGATAGISWALTLIGLRWLSRDEATNEATDAEVRRTQGAGLSAVAVGNLLACGIALPGALSTPSELTDSHAIDWAMIGYLGVVQIGLAYVLLTRGFRKVPAFEASLLILIEPTLNPLWAWLFQSEVPSGWALLGGATILTASTFKTWLNQRERSVAEL